MTTGFAYKTSADAGAPQLSNTFGSWIAVLDYLLDPQYWDKVFTGTNEAAYRAKAGNRNFLHVKDNQNYAALVRAYSDMTSLTEGADMYPPADYVPGSYWFRAYVTTTPAPSPAEYRAVVTDRFILLAISSGAAGRGHDIVWFGDIAPEAPADRVFSSLRTQTYSSTVPLGNHPSVGSTLGSESAQSTQYIGRNTFGALSRPATEGNSPDAWGPEFGVGSPGPAPYRRLNSNINNSAGALAAGIDLIEHRLSLPVNQFPNTTVPAMWVGRVPFLYQSSSPSLTTPQHTDTFETVDGARFLAWDCYGTSTPSNSYMRWCLMVSDNEVGLP